MRGTLLLFCQNILDFNGLLLLPGALAVTAVVAAVFGGRGCLLRGVSRFVVVGIRVDLSYIIRKHIFSQQR